MEWRFETAQELFAALSAGAVTSVELTDEAIARIERDDDVINAICVPDFDRARAAALRAAPRLPGPGPRRTPAHRDRGRRAGGCAPGGRRAPS
jgi:Asp-tRNA(Asn)/Glu-tRNA(Gln) amidotransferase A subunit family amidase